MKNAETRVLKLALYGAHSSLGSALLSEWLSRQHEAVAVVGDLNAIDVHPGLRAKLGDLYDPLSVSESVAGMDAVVVYHAAPNLPDGAADRPPNSAGSPLDMLAALNVGMPRVGVKHLLLIIEPDLIGDAERHLLLNGPLDWTLVTPPPITWRFDLDDFRDAAHADPDSELYRLRRFAAALADELESPQHLCQRITIRYTAPDDVAFSSASSACNQSTKRWVNR